MLRQLLVESLKEGRAVGDSYPAMHDVHDPLFSVFVFSHSTF